MSRSAFAMPNVARPFRSPRASRRIATRRDAVLSCQAVRERDFKLLADRTLDVSPEGMLLPISEPVLTGETLIVSFPIPGLWIDAEATVTRIVHGRRPGDDGLLAMGVVFDVISPAARAALAGYLHGRPPPLPRRGPLARLRRGDPQPILADEAVVKGALQIPAFALDEDIEDLVDDVDALGVLRELATAWKRLADSVAEQDKPDCGGDRA